MSEDNVSLDLYDVLKNSYSSKDKQLGAFKNQGYVYDSSLSNENYQTYYNPEQKKLLYTIKGTDPTSLKDLGTDLYLAAGYLKGTDRYKEALKGLQKAKKRYGVESATVTGHSLGSTIANYIASGKDKVFGLDGGYTFGQKV